LSHLQPAQPALDPAKFRDPRVTAKGERRAAVALSGLRTLWVNTGTLCNIACRNCYIESGPRNDALVYLTAAEVAAYLDEIARDRLPVEEIGFTGGEPFLNRELPAMLRDALGRGHRALVLTNAMKPMRRHASALLALRAEFGADRLTLRVSLDHHEAAPHDLERGEGAFAAALDGLAWLARGGFRVHVAGRAGFGRGEGEAAVREGFARLFADRAIPVDASDPVALVLFPEMDAGRDVPEITESCWGVLGKGPEGVMCASARMVVKRKGAARPAVLACTLLPYDPRFELGATLGACRNFCVEGPTLP
jgi:uncharacterized Fe-S cluster-containing radical SAM superfamily protein